MNLPVEIKVAILGGALAAVGYFGKSLISWRQDRQKYKAQNISELQRLQSLLNASRTLFDLQQEQVDRLLLMIEENHPAEYNPCLGFEERMESCYPIFDKTEREIHGIIRAYSEHSLRPINLAMSAWLRSDMLFKTGLVKSRRRKALAKNLFDLEIHLLLWNAKYVAWLPGQPHHALVYMADENEHGLGFPGDRIVKENGEDIYVEGTDNCVAAVLKELRGR